MTQWSEILIEQFHTHEIDPVFAQQAGCSLVWRGEIMTDEEKQPQRGKRKGKPRRHGSGSVFRRPERKGKQWVAQIVLENGKTRQRYFKTQAEADEALNKMLYELRQGTLITEKDQTVKQHFERWLAVHKTKIRHSTYLTYRSA